MLRIIQNQAASSAKSYYSTAAYYSEGQELAGRWGGRTAERLGLAGTIDQRDFNALCDNLHPQTGERLTARTRTDRTVGYDVNIHVPKGVSLAYLLGGDERILIAFQDSVRETMADLECDAETRVRVGGRQQDRRTGNLVWGEFIHKTARPVNGVPDPHLHAHCFVFNVTYDETEQRYKAAQFRHLKQDAGYYEALVHARLAKRLVELGYTIERTGRRWDIAEIPRSMRDKFSRRRDQIEVLARAKGITDDAEKDALGARTRERKQGEFSMAELRQLWMARLTDGENAALHPPEAGPVPARDADERAAQDAAAKAVAHCFERSAVLPERSVLAEALRRGVGEADPDNVARAVTSQGLLTQAVNGRRLSTTQAAISQEQAIIDFVRSGRGSTEPLHANWSVQRAWLGAEQQAAVRQLVESRDRVQLLHGGAGTGKTALMQEAAAAIEAGGRQVWAFAPSAAASRGVLRDEGFAGATTVAELLVNESLQARAAGQVWWVDEAGLLGTRQLHDLTQLAAKLDAHLILSGDWRQHASVERGGMLAQIARRSGIKAVELSSIRRQQGSYRAAVQAIASGDVAAGFDQLDALGWIKELPDGERNEAIARDYAAAVAGAESCLVVAPTHAEGSRLTAAIRARLRSEGMLGQGETRLRRLQPLHLTESERSDAAFYSPGDVIEFHQNAPGHRKGERITLSAPPSQDLLQHSRRFSAYRAESIAIAAGDRVRWTANIKTADGKHRLNNGAGHDVAALTPNGDMVLANGWVVSCNVGHVDYGFVSTSHASQGRTVDRVILAESSESLPAAGAEQFYVSVSRGRKRATVYTNDKKALRSAVQESQLGMTASELMALQQRQQAAAQRSLGRERIVEAQLGRPTNVRAAELAYGS